MRCKIDSDMFDVAFKYN